MKTIKIEWKTYKTKKSVLKDKINILPYSFVIKNIITGGEWAESEQKIVERFNLNITEEKIDGRKKEYKNLPYFSWWILETL